MEEVKVALDWTPNTNHVGFFVAQSLHFYSKVGLKVDLISPHVDRYEVTPAAKVASKDCTFALAPSETVVSYHLPPTRPKLVAIASVLQKDLSAIVTLKSSGLSRPKLLDGKRYASYGARFEGRIVQQLIRADGGKGDYEEYTPNKLGIWNTVISGEADATWIFKGWEGIEASVKNIELHMFDLGDYGIPYGYSPVVVAHPDTLSDQTDVVRKFLHATGEGFAYAAASPTKAAALLIEAVQKQYPSLPNKLDPALVLASSQMLSKYFLDEQCNWGSMKEETWVQYMEWLFSQGLVTSHVQSRNPVPGISVSLDDLRQGHAGDLLAPSSLLANSLFSNAYNVLSSPVA